MPRHSLDRGFLVTLVEDASATYTPARHAATLGAIKGYCRIRKTADVLAELPGAGVTESG